MKTLKILFSGLLLLMSPALLAEPYLAVKSGHQCAICHVSPTGGGMRTEFGQAYGRSLAADAETVSKITSELNDYLRIGANFRATALSKSTSGKQDEFDLQTDRASVYLHADLIPQTMSLYIDQQFAPGSINREVWLMYQNEDAFLYARAGKFFLPYGLKLEDDAAFIRAVSEINFSTPDNGIELGLDKKKWNAQLAITNGTDGSIESNTDKEVSLRGVYIQPDWRLGTSLNYNKDSGNKREMFNLFAGFNLFSATWLFEIDFIEDTQTVSVTQQVFFAEVNKEISKGHNIKLTIESHDPNIDVDEDERTRNSLVWEYFPIQQVQVRTGVRISDGIPQRPQDNTDEIFVNLHAWF